MSKTIDWEPIKADYFSENLCTDSHGPFTLKELAVRWHISYRSLLNRSSLDHWNDELKERIAARNRKFIDLAQEREAINEIEVRTRQAVVSREMLDMALSKLRTIRPQDLSKKEAIELLKIGLTEERRALGLADKYEFKAQVNQQERFSPVEEMIKGHQSIEVLAFTAAINPWASIRLLPCRGAGSNYRNYYRRWIDCGRCPNQSRIPGRSYRCNGNC